MVIAHLVFKIRAQLLKRKVAIENCTIQDGTDPNFGIPHIYIIRKNAATEIIYIFEALVA